MNTKQGERIWIYCTAPVDFFGGYTMLLDCPEEERDDDGFYTKALHLLSLAKKAWPIVGWEGDDHGAYVFPIPSKECSHPDPCVIVKQGNNGSTFFASFRSVVSLHEDGYGSIYYAVVNVDDANGSVRVIHKGELGRG